MNDNTTNTSADDVSVNLSSDEGINLFIEGLMEEKGIEATSEELRKDIFTDLKARLMEEIDRSLVAALPDEKLDELSKMVASDGKIEPEVIGKMVEEAGIDVDEVIGVTMAKFRDLYLGEEAEDEAEETEGGAEEVEEAEEGNGAE